MPYSYNLTIERVFGIMEKDFPHIDVEEIKKSLQSIGILEMQDFFRLT